MTRHIRLIVEYDGTNLCGWQRQANGPTVQQHLEEALARLLDHEVTVIGASRTDAGVHARGQVACFRTARDIPLHGIRRAVNALLPDAIAIRDAANVPDDFHPRLSATGKLYRYAILTRPDRSPLTPCAWHHPEPLDLPAMIEASRALIGEHDFSAFRAAGCTAKTANRRIDAIDVTRRGEVVELDVRGNAFLRNMVRILIGTLADVGTGQLPVAQVPEIIASRDRTRAGPTAPAHGLVLVEVSYDGTRVSSSSVTR
jgi:tRNA pseudouridine38-40 synthase